MSNKELLEQAKDTTKKQLGLIEDIEKAESFLTLAQRGKIGFYVKDYGYVYLEDTVELETLEVVKDLGLTAIMNYRDNRTKELEKLLGIRKPATINPEFEAAVQGMVPSVKKPEPDPVEEKLSAILKQEEAKHNPKKGKQTNIYPEGMTVEAVTKLYIGEKQSRKVIADHFGVNASAVNNFLFRHGIKRDKARDNKPSKKKPEETERP